MVKGKITNTDSFFPKELKNHEPAMKTLYYAGNLQLLEERAIAVVGSRNCTQYGRTVAKSIGAKCAENGVILVSGLARGIDTAAHKGASEAGGNTIAVVGGGTEYYYPSENRKLQQEIAEKGLLLSIHEHGYQPKPYDFPVRNRIISSLCEHVVVVEAGNQSGALITAVDAVEKGRGVYAVPGNITSHFSFGTNQLIRDGAMPLIFIDDLFIDMGLKPNINETIEANLGDAEKKVFEVIKNDGEVTIDQIYHKTNMKLSEISGIITILEMKGLIFSSLGKVFVAKF